MDSQTQPSPAKWRHFVALALLSFYILAVVFRNYFAPSSSSMLPSKIGDFFVFSTREMLVFGAFWLLAWLFSRAKKDELFLRWQGGWNPLLQGLLYSFGLRIGLLMILVGFSILAGIVAVSFGIKPEQLKQFIQQYSPSPDAVINSAALKADPLYRLVLLSWGSFVVAGLREELWRAGMMSAGIKLLQPALSPRNAALGALIFSSVLFGLGHLYQGVLAVGATALIGVMLGAITLKHRSIWPAVIAHGAFDAVSFLMLPLAKQLIKP